MLSACASSNDGPPTVAVDPDDEPTIVDCLVIGVEPGPDHEPDDYCDSLPRPTPTLRPCEDVWHLGTRFPVPYYGCSPSDGDDRVAFDLGVECDDPGLDGYWQYGDLMAGGGFDVFPAKLALLDDGRPDC